MGILGWLAFGLIAGAIAQVLMPGDDPGGSTGKGCLTTIVIGISGAVVGGLLGSVLGLGGVSGFNLGSLFVAVLGALIVLYLWKHLRTRR